MSTAFDRWEKDPFFSAAEEVQESADRMESVYRRWINERKVREDDEEKDITGELRRELHTVLGTAKWQLEEFDRASKARYMGLPADDEARARHTQFVSAIGDLVLSVEGSLRRSEIEEGRAGMSWVRLDEGERDELAAFLSGPPAVENSAVGPRHEESRCTEDGIKPQMADERVPAHRRTASAGNDSAVWAISLSNEDSPRKSSDDRQHPHMPKVLSMSRLSGMVESTSKSNWPKNGFRKWKNADQLQASETIPLHNHQVGRGLDSCCESCSNESYNKQLHGWFGAIQRQLQRSQYRIQYGRPLQMIFWVVAALLLIVLFVLGAM